MKFPKIDNTKFLYQLVSLLFALLLFFYVNYQRLGSTRTTDNKPQAPAVLMTNKTVKMTMPLAVNVDNDKYFVTGYPEKVQVKLVEAETRHSYRQIQDFRTQQGSNGFD